MQQQESQPITFEQKVNILQNIALFPALTIMVFLRRKVGFRFLDMLKIQAMVVLLLAYGAFSTLSFGPAAGGAISLFAFAVLIAAIIERRLRWHEIKRGVSWHSYSRGVSWFNSFLPVSETTARRFIDPSVALGAGAVFFFLLRPLGFYLLLSGVCLFLFETIDYQKQIDLMLDQLDNLVESEVVSENVEYFQDGGASGTRPVEQTAGISTGVSPDLAAAVARRQTKKPKQSHSSIQPPSQQQAAIPLIKSLDDPAFAALPSGAQFLTPDGKTRWKN